MLSFSRKAKMEVISTPIENDCCSVAFLSGLFHASGELSLSNKKIQIEIVTDLKELYYFINKILGTLYGDVCEIEISDDFAINKKTYYRIVFPQDRCSELLEDTGIIQRFDVGKYDISHSVPDFVTSAECCKKAFIKGAFVGCATSNIKISEVVSEKTTSGYHIEFTSHNKEFLESICEMLKDYQILAKITERKNSYVLYLKEASKISDLLALVDAYNSVMELQNEICAREMRNKINRETNCFSANISKTVAASMKQVQAIEKIKFKAGLEYLSDDLQEVALLRLANQEESLEELLQLSTIKLTKSGLNHRFRKIIKIAENL
ncbi:MAG: DNA-binding protein WhiA [Clostridia bacterium]